MLGGPVGHSHLVDLIRMHDSISALMYASTPPIAPLHLYFLLLAMAAAEAPAAPIQADETPTGPQQRGRGSSGQYVYWVTHVYPKPETIARLGVWTPDDFDRAAFMELIVKVHKECNNEPFYIRNIVVLAIGLLGHY